MTTPWEEKWSDYGKVCTAQIWEPIDPTIAVGPFSIVETARIGKHTVIGPYTHVMRNSVIGAHCTLEGCVIEGGIIGDSTRVYRNTHVMQDAKIGKECLIGACCFIADGAVIGNNVRMMLNVGIARMVVIEDDVYIGPNVVFCNANPGEPLHAMRVGKGAWIGTNVVTTPGVSIGAGAVIGAGSVVTKDVPPGVTVVGNPARVLRK